MERMSGPRILVLFGLLLLVAGVVIGLPSSLAPAAVVIAAAAVLVLFGADRSSPNPGSRSDPVTSVRAAFGPAVDAMDAVAVYTLDRSGRIGYANRGARRVLDVDGRDVEGRSASELPAAGSETPEMVEGLNEVFETGRPRVARRIMLLADGTTRVESIVSMTPVVRYGKVVEAAVWRVDTRGPALSLIHI